MVTAVIRQSPVEPLLKKCTSACPEESVTCLSASAWLFENFTPENDPYYEHDFGSFEHEGKTIFWKIDCYDRDRNYGSPDPADPSVTMRILTVMLAEEY